MKKISLENLRIKSEHDQNYCIIVITSRLQAFRYCVNKAFIYKCETHAACSECYSSSAQNQITVKSLTGPSLKPIC